MGKIQDGLGKTSGLIKSNPCCRCLERRLGTDVYSSGKGRPISPKARRETCRASLTLLLEASSSRPKTRCHRRLRPRTDYGGQIRNGGGNRDHKNQATGVAKLITDKSQLDKKEPGKSRRSDRKTWNRNVQPRLNKARSRLVRVDHVTSRRRDRAPRKGRANCPSPAREDAEPGGRAGSRAWKNQRGGDRCSRLEPLGMGGRSP